MLKGLKLSYRKKYIKRLLMIRAKESNNLKDYIKHSNDYKRMKSMKRYLRSDMLMLGMVSNMADELNALTRIARNDTLYKETIASIKEDIKKYRNKNKA